MSQGGAEAGWYDDPYGRFEKRWYDGTTWTDQVWQAGQQQVDPPVTPPVGPVSAASASQAPLAGGGPGAGAGPVAGAPGTGTPLPPWLGALAAPLVAVVATIVLSTVFDLFPRFILFTTKNGLESTGKRAFVALVFGALLGAAVLGGPKLVAALGAGGSLDQDDLMPLALGAAGGAAAGLVTQVIGFRIVDLILFDPLIDHLGSFLGRMIFAVYYGLIWALFGAVLGAVALAPLAGPDPAAKRRLPMLAAGGFVGGAIGGFLFAPGRFDFGGTGSAVISVLLVAAAYGFASLLAAQGLGMGDLAEAANKAAGNLGTAAGGLGGGAGAAGSAGAPAGAGAWHPDPTGRHQQRWWDGQQWTDHVSDGGATSSDP
ncbi:MAG: DUF2510 domain-containing protein, partial [Acidimicrobiales bacterium]|nr:DUF2510 domain-containing protein [Acidimicrobiales bacterium]